MNPDKTLILRQQKIIEELEKNVMKLQKGNDYLKAELVYWQETAINWRDKYEEAEFELQYQYEEAKSEIDYWQSYY